MLTFAGTGNYVCKNNKFTSSIYVAREVHFTHWIL